MLYHDPHSYEQRTSRGWTDTRRDQVFVPAAFTVFPGELWRAPRTWVERTYSNLIYFKEVGRGGPLAAWEHGSSLRPKSARVPIPALIRDWKAARAMRAVSGRPIMCFAPRRTVSA